MRSFGACRTKAVIFYYKNMSSGSSGRKSTSNKIEIDSKEVLLQELRKLVAVKKQNLLKKQKNAKQVQAEDQDDQTLQSSNTSGSGGGCSCKFMALYFLSIVVAFFLFGLVLSYFTKTGLQTQTLLLTT